MPSEPVIPFLKFNPKKIALNSEIWGIGKCFVHKAK